jgi:cyclin-dependent kinase
VQMEEEGVPSTALREVSLLQMLNETVFIVR